MFFGQRVGADRFLPPTYFRKSNEVLRVRVGPDDADLCSPDPFSLDATAPYQVSDQPIEERKKTTRSRRKTTKTNRRKQTTKHRAASKRRRTAKSRTTRNKSTHKRRYHGRGTVKTRSIVKRTRRGGRRISARAFYNSGGRLGSVHCYDGTCKNGSPYWG